MRFERSIGEWWLRGDGCELVGGGESSRGKDLGERVAAALTAHGIAHELRVSQSADSVADVVAEGAANGFTLRFGRWGRARAWEVI